MPDFVRLRNITKDELTVAPLGGRRVGADCVVDVPRDVFKNYAWSETVWRNETPARSNTQKGE